jgi:CheY-like chemotaxis protein
MTIKKIIIIDDDNDYINEIEELLVLKDYEIVKKNNTDDILNFVKTNKPDLVILDLKINGLTGIDVAKMLKNDPKTNGLPIILLSNFYNDNEGDFSKDNVKHGINVCLKKTVKPEILIEEIKKIEYGQLSTGKVK